MTNEGKQIAVRLSSREVALVDAIREKTGIQSTADIVRVSLRALAQKEGVPLPPQAGPKRKKSVR